MTGVQTCALPICFHYQWIPECGLQKPYNEALSAPQLWRSGLRRPPERLGVVIDKGRQ